MLATGWEEWSWKQTPHHISLLAYEVGRRQATNSADRETTQTHVGPTYDLRHVYGTRGLGCWKFHSAEYEMVISGRVRALGRSELCARRELQASLIHLAAELF